MKTACPALVLALLFCGSAPCGAGPAADEAAIQVLMDEYGKDALIEVIIEKRFGEVTVETDGHLASTFGRPNKAGITPRSVRADLEKAGLSVADLTAAVESKLHKDQLRSERLQQSPPATPAAPQTGVTHQVSVQTGELDQACVDGCLASHKPCFAAVNEHSNTCAKATDATQCLRENRNRNQACMRGQDACRRGCFR